MSQTTISSADSKVTISTTDAPSAIEVGATPSPETVHAIGEHNEKEAHRKPARANAPPNSSHDHHAEHSSSPTSTSSASSSATQGLAIEGWVSGQPFKDGVSGMLGVMATGVGMLKSALEHTKEWVDTPRKGPKHARMDVGPISIQIGAKERPKKNDASTR